MDEYPQYTKGTLINKRYQVLDHFPAGGMGWVAKVKQIDDGAIVALKYCRLRDEVSRRRFARETRVMTRIDHPHVLPVLRHSMKHSPPYFTMELARCSIEDELSELSSDENSALTVFRDVAAGIQAIHNAGAVHRDIKPSNILRMNDDRVVVADLGVAKFAERDTTILTQARAVIGTDMYAAPEQKMPDGSREADERTDIYQLGKTLYQLLTARKPILMDLNKVPSGLAHIIKRATRENPDDRYQSLGQLLDAVAVYERGKDPKARPIDTFRSVLSVVEDRVSKGRFKEAELDQLIQILLAFDESDDDGFLDLFDELPEGVLRVAAAQLHDTFEPVIRRYAQTLFKIVGTKNFAYAEVVSEKMTIVFRSGTDTDLRVMALQALLIAAVDLNRFAAMSAFDELLLEVKDDGLAMGLADMLRGQHRKYQALADRVPAARLHPTLREVRAKVLKER